MRRFAIVLALLALALAVACKQEVQYSGTLGILNATNEDIKIESNLQTAGSRVVFPLIINPACYGLIAETDESPTAIESYASNIREGKVDVFVQRGGQWELARTYTYEGRFSSDKELFNLNHSETNPGKDLSGKSVTLSYIFRISGDDL